MDLHSLYFPGPESSGTPLLVLHGLFGSSGNWRALAKQLARHRDVYALDLRNHGQSPHADSMTFEDMAGDVGTFAKKTRLTHFDLLGHSMGGKVAMQLALTAPDLVSRLIVADIAPKSYPPRHQDVFRAIHILSENIITQRNQADELVKDVLPNQATRLFLLTNLIRNEHGRFTWRVDMQAIENNYNAISDAPSASVSTGLRYEKPTLFIRGEGSSYIQEKDVELIAHLFPNYRLHTITSAGHWVHAEQPTQFLKTVELFLNTSDLENT